MSVTRAEVLRMARLARLELADDEADALTDELAGILEHMEKLDEASAGDPGDAGEPDGVSAPLRDGRSDEPDPLHRAPGELAPEWREGFFVVPRLPGVEDGEPRPEGEPGEPGR